MTSAKIVNASIKAHTLDEATQALIKSVEAKDRRFRLWCYSLLTVLLVVGIMGIYKQNEIATKNQQHIDCIVKLFTTPLPNGDKSRIIVNSGSTCDIRFTK